MSDSHETAQVRLAKSIRDIKDFPKPGIVFKDITTLLQDKEMFALACESLSTPFKDDNIDIVVGLEARGFIFGAPVALQLHAGFVPLRKAGKLPWRTKKVGYTLEYGESLLEIHEDAVKPGQRVLIIDDVLATGGSAAAALELVQSIGGEVAGFSFLMELESLQGASRLGDYKKVSVIII